MHRRPHTAPERTSLGMGVVAVALGVGCGVADSIARYAHRYDESGDTVATHEFASPRRVDAVGSDERRSPGARVRV